MEKVNHDMNYTMNFELNRAPIPHPGMLKRQKITIILKILKIEKFFNSEHTATEYNYSGRLVMSIVIKLMSECCITDKIVHPNIVVFRTYSSVWVYRFDRVVSSGSGYHTLLYGVGISSLVITLQ